MTYQHTHSPARSITHRLSIDADEVERTAVDVGERLLSIACWLMISAGGIGLLFVADKAVRNALHTLHGCGAC